MLFHQLGKFSIQFFRAFARIPSLTKSCWEQSFLPERCVGFGMDGEGCVPSSASLPPRRSALSASVCQSKYADFKQNFLRLGDDAPDFEADSSLGKINFHEWIGQPEERNGTGPRGQTEAVTSPPHHRAAD
jgi:hypothetical protein